MAKWYLKRNGKESGPGTEDQLRAAFKKRTITLDAEVRREDETQWIRLRDAAILDPADSNPFIDDRSQSDPPAAGTEKPLIHKEMFQEKPRYGGKGTRRYPTFSERFIALLIDWIILFFSGLIFLSVPWIGSVVQFVIGVAYLTYLQHDWGYTLGRKIMGMHVETLDGKKPGLDVFVIRFFGEMLSGFLFGAGFFVAAFDPKLRTLHDRIAGTVVVKD